jgi:hypothetical protein
MSPFKKLKNFDATANVLSYAYFQVSTVQYLFSYIKKVLVLYF